MNLKDKVPVMHCAGVEGPSLYINNFRVCGPKPWGGGRIIREWKSAEKGDILRALGDNFLQAVNSHEALVEALRRVKRDCVDEYGERVRPKLDTLIEVDDALRKAGA